jgi:carbamoyltransferase
MSSDTNVVLSLSLSYDSGAALFVGGKLLAAVGEERLNRIKNTRDFPTLSIAECLRIAGVAPTDVGLVLLASRITPNWLSLKLPKFHEGESTNLFSPLLYPVVAEQWLVRKTGLIGLEAQLVKGHVRKQLKALGISAPFKVFDHHTIHGYCAYSGADFDNSLVITLDAMGDGISAGAFLGNNGKLTQIHEMSGFSTPAYIYSQITQLLGFRPSRHEGKITGLAAYGDAKVTLPIFRQILAYENRKFRVKRITSRDAPLYKQLLTHSREDIAAGVQYILEEVVVAFVKDMLKASGRTKLACAGGVFANVKLNQRLFEIDGVENISIYPNMGDGGLPVGAGYAHFGIVPGGIDNIFLGDQASDAECLSAIEQSGLPYTRPTDISLEAAHLLADNKIVARCAGRMEYGPRALGNRSIMAKGDDPTVNDWLNKKLKRTEFMPFAPSTLDEYADRYYVNLGGARSTARYMTITFGCTEESRKVQPACVHVDGTARPQLVTATDNPGYHAIISRFHDLTGVASVLNTSFNVHEEPIVNSPADALKAFRQCRLDALILGPFLVRQKD